MKAAVTPSWKRYALPIFLIFLVPAVVSAQADEWIAAQMPDSVLNRMGSRAPATFSPNVEPHLRLELKSGEIAIDGRLGDAGWLGAALATNFTEFQPDEGKRPPIDISAWVTFDDSRLYIAFRILDDPRAIRANHSDRDQIWNDDYVGVLLDPTGDGQTLFFLGVNPFGIQGDTRISGNDNEDVGFDIIWESAGRITDDGYIVEMAVPFRSLRFPSREGHAWRGTFWITHPRDSRSQYSWASLNRDNACFPCQMGYLEGLDGVRSGRNLEALPTLVGGESGALRIEDDPNSGFDNGRVKLEPSLDLKYGIRSDLTAELTLNPDFSQIESDAAQIDVNTTFALFFEERRPFFQEGSDLFLSHLETMYSRSINDPIFAGKLTGRVGGTSVAFLTARDNNTPILLPFEERSELVQAGKSLSNIGRLRHAFKDNSYLGALLTDRRLDGGGSGSTVGIDGVKRLGRRYSVDGQFVMSRTVEVNDPELSADFEEVAFSRGAHTTALDGETFNGHALYAGFNRDARHYMFRLRYRQISPTFRADNGFIRQNDLRTIQAWQGVNVYPKDIGFIDRIMPNLAVWRSWNFDQVRKEQGVQTEVMFMMKGQTQAFASYSALSEQFKGVDFPNVHRFVVGAFTNFSSSVSLGSFVQTGTDVNRGEDVPVLGNSLSIDGRATVRPTDRLVISPNITFAELRDRVTDETFYSGYVLRTRLTYQFTRALTLRTVLQYNDFNEQLEFDPLLTYRINPFTVFHVGSTHDMRSLESTLPNADPVFLQTSRQFFFKFQYLVQA